MSRALAVALAALFALVGIVRSAAAQSIGPGHEAAVLALFAPHALGAQVEGGFALWGVYIEPKRVRVVVRRADGAEGRMLLVHPETAPAVPRSASFALSVDADAPEAARPALERLGAAVRTNDRGGFWERAVVPAGDPVAAGSGGAAQGVRRPSLWDDRDWIPVDGALVLLLVVALASLLAARLLRGEPRWVAASLVAAVVAGIAVRLWMAPPTFLGAWPWTRLYPHARAVAQGAGLESVASLTGTRLFVTDVTLWTNFAYAAAMPLVLFSHATYLLRDARAGVAASAAIALLPQHIRFSRCEDGFVASLVLTSLAFAMIHGWLRDPSPRVRLALLATLPVVLYPALLLRPLNLVFVGLYVVALAALHGETATRARRLVGLAVVLGVAALASSQFWARNAGQASTAVSARLLGDTLAVLRSPSLLVMSDPTRTPPALLGLAVLGAVLGWRAGARRLVAFLVAWFFLFVVLHAVVIQESMQPRYHLHLVVPFLLLGAAAVAYAPAAWRAHRAAWAVAALAAASLLAAPVAHAAFIRDDGYTEQREYAFVRSLRDEVPESCTLVEYVGGHRGEEGGGSRFQRIGWYATPGREWRYSVVQVHRGGQTTPGTPTLDDLAERSPACLYVYEGLACATESDPAERHVCAALRERFRAEVLHELTVPVRLYDAAVDPDHVARTSPEVSFRLSRARPPAR